MADLSDHVLRINPKVREGEPTAEEKTSMHDYKAFQYATFAHDMPDFASF